MHVAATYDSANTYIYGPDGAPLEQITSAGVVTFLHHDQLGSTRLITSTSGANVGSYRFDPYGTQTAKTGTATTPLGYAGQYTDAESGLIYMRARYYDPATGTFTSPDPIGSLGSGQNLYGYVGGDPLNFIDPSGLFSISGGLNWLADNAGTIGGVVATVGCIAGAPICTSLLIGALVAGTASNLNQVRQHKMCWSEFAKRGLIDASLTFIGGSASKAILGGKKILGTPVPPLKDTIDSRLGRIGARGAIFGALGVAGAIPNINTSTLGASCGC